ncbi:MAG: PadR family transcriptional regulator [Propionibacteriaceae bacterium]|jgi:DNA-binding PadR family transcriptional regulator|nr:PadR family transcriptional regulator [Propionibacteriaceae bacterium]
MPKQDYYKPGQLTDTAFITLAALTEPRHGYKIMHEVEAQTNGEINLGPASLYTTLRKLAEAGLIALISEEDNKKVYQATESGLEALRLEVNKRRKLADYGEQAINNYTGEQQ